MLNRQVCTERIGEFTAEARRAPSKGFFIRKYSELCVLCVSVVKKDSDIAPLRHGERGVKGFLLRKYSELCVLYVSAVKKDSDISPRRR